jgi:hypothetical protein
MSAEAVVREITGILSGILLAGGLVSVLVKRYFVKIDSIESKLEKLIELTTEVEGIKEDIREIKNDLRHR